MLEKVIGAGADIVRLNMAHAKHDWTRTVIRRIRAVSARLGREVAIMMDIKGPEIRTGDVSVPIELKAGEIFDFTVKPGLSDRENARRSAPSTSTTRTSSTTSRSATPCSSTTASSGSRSSPRTTRTSAAACSSPASSPPAATSTSPA
jgi:hypothetical protein